MLAALACVRYVVTFDEDTPLELVKRLRPDVLVKGGTYVPEEIVGYDVVTSYGGRVTVCGVVEGISTSNILASLAKNSANVPSPHFAKANVPTARGDKPRG
jgi:D-beta-D-heptose 7-phosphate kinase/D-beta-D-heptose 1-phosphate adenosyltransferase